VLDWGWVVNAMPRLLYPGNALHPLYSRLGGPQGQSGWVQKILLPPGLDHQTIHPVVSLTILITLLTCNTVQNKCIRRRHTYICRILCPSSIWSLDPDYLLTYLLCCPASLSACRTIIPSKYQKTITQWQSITSKRTHPLQWLLLLCANMY
jgi:hypothetical protein